MREVSDEERVAGLRLVLTNAVTIAEAFKAAFEDNIPLNRESSIQSLDELIRCLHSVNIDLEPVES